MAKVNTIVDSHTAITWAEAVLDAAGKPEFRIRISPLDVRVAFAIVRAFDTAPQCDIELP